MIKINNILGNKFQGNLQNSSSTVVIYDGEIPTVDGSFVYAPANFTPLGTVLLGTTVSGNKLKIANTGGVAFKGLATGTAKWFALYPTATPSMAILGTITSDSTAKAALLLDNVNIVPTTTASFSLVDLSINFIL